MKNLSSSRFYLSNSSKLLIPQLIILMGLVALSLIGIKIGMNKLQQQKTLISKLKKEQSLYKDKIEALQSGGLSVNSDADTLSWALPNKSPVLVVSSQIKSVSQSLIIPITDLKISQAGNQAGGMATVVVGFTAEGSFDQLFSFMELIEKTFPIMSITKIDISQRGGLAEAGITATAFWAKSPSKMPAVSDPIARITPAELEILDKIADYSKPAFGTEIPPSVSTRTNPF